MIVVEWVRLSRWREWAQSKLPYAGAMTVLLAGSLPGLRLIEVLASVAAGAAFGYGLNEVADRAYDSRAGKPNRAVALRPRRWASFLVLSSAVALGMSLLWAPDAAGTMLVAAALALATAYSAPPLRLKERGGAGLVAAASAQWALPVLAVSASRPGGWLTPPAWCAAALSLAVGVRWMAVHRIEDAAADARGRGRTYGSRVALRRLAVVALACELALLVATLGLTWPDSALASLALGAWALAAVLLGSSRDAVGDRLTTFARAPLAGFYFFALPFATGLTQLGASRADRASGVVLLALSASPLVAFAGPHASRLRRATIART